MTHITINTNINDGTQHHWENAGHFSKSQVEITTYNIYKG